MIAAMIIFVAFSILFGIYSFYVVRKMREYSYAGDFTRTMSLLYIIFSLVIVIGIIVWIVTTGNPAPPIGG